jgi:hypothetical protein
MRVKLFLIVDSLIVPQKSFISLQAELSISISKKGETLNRVVQTTNNDVSLRKQKLIPSLFLNYTYFLLFYKNRL